MQVRHPGCQATSEGRLWEPTYGFTVGKSYLRYQDDMVYPASQGRMASAFLRTTGGVPVRLDARQPGGVLYQSGLLARKIILAGRDLKAGKI